MNLGTCRKKILLGISSWINVYFSDIITARKIRMYKVGWQNNINGSMGKWVSSMKLRRFFLLSFLLLSSYCLSLVFRLMLFSLRIKCHCFHVACILSWYYIKGWHVFPHLQLMLKLSRTATLIYCKWFLYMNTYMYL